MKRLLFCMAGLSLLCAEAVAQAPRTISHQGLLTDLAGQPVVDSTWSIKFSIHDGSGSGEIWSSTEAVATTNGIYDVILGPITGVDFHAALELGVKIEPSEPEITPRTPLTSVPSTFALVLPYQATDDTTTALIDVENEGPGAAIRGSNSGMGSAGHFAISSPSNAAAALQVETSGTGLGLHSMDAVEVQVNDLNLNPTAQFLDVLTLESEDAVLGIYSGAGGAFGSTLALAEVDGSGNLIDKWSIVRRTGQAAASLRFTFGPSANYGANDQKIAFDTTGNVWSSGYRYFTPRTGYASLSALAFTPQQIDTATIWINHPAGGHFTSHSSLAGTARASLQLPHGATVTSFACEIVDESATHDLRCQLFQNAADAAFNVMGEVTSTGSSGLATYQDTTIVNAVVDNSLFGYTVLAYEPTAGVWETPGVDLRIRRVFVEYTLSVIP